MNVVLTQNFYNLMNAIHNMQDSGVPTEFSNAADVDGGRNLITMKTGTYSDTGGYFYHPTGTQKIIQLGKYGKLSADNNPEKVRVYSQDLLTYEELGCDARRYAMTSLLSYPGYVGAIIATTPHPEQQTHSLNCNCIAFAPSEDTMPITRATTAANEDLPILLGASGGPRMTVKDNGISVHVKYYGTVNFNMNKIYIVIPAQAYDRIGPVIIAGINLDNTIVLEPNQEFDIFLGCTSVFA